jgi:glycosyltransferase involved in cell wall biosynthesis
VKVLYVNHTGLVSGGERSLLGLLESLPADVEPRLAGPPGPLHEHADRIGTPTASIVGTACSLKLHPVHTPVAVAAMAVAAGGVLRAAHSWQADVLHANSIRAGMIADPVARALRRPLVVHVRDCLPPSPVTRRLQARLALRAGAVIAISDHVANAFDPRGVSHRLRIIDNPFDLAKLDPGRIDRVAARHRLGIADDDKVLALVGQITPWKGQEDAIRALARVRDEHPTAVLLLVGEAKFVARATRYDNRAYLCRLHELTARLGLGDAVRFLGEREDVPEILRACDVALLPSWDEPFGRAAVEAMAMGAPVVATSIGGPAEIITDGVDGTLVQPRDPARLAIAVNRLLRDPQRRQALGRAARKSVKERFGRDRHASSVTALYRELLSTDGEQKTSGYFEWRGSLHFPPGSNSHMPAPKP